MEIEQGTIFRHDFGPRQNDLQEGPRPVLVVQTDDLNGLEGYSNVIVIPLTTKQRKSATYVPIQPSASNTLSALSWAITNQIFTLDKDKLKIKHGRVSKEEMYAVKRALRIVLDLAD